MMAPEYIKIINEQFRLQRLTLYFYCAAIKMLLEELFMFTIHGTQRSYMRFLNLLNLKQNDGIYNNISTLQVLQRNECVNIRSFNSDNAICTKPYLYL